MNGIFLLHKPSGLTSHDVVNAVRRLAGIRRVGHAGTLDPLATGLLVVLVGQATRLAQYLTGHDKTYRAVIRLGETTDTYDAEGTVTARRPVTATAAELEAALAGFLGPQMQCPPAYSAIKVAGQALYKRARRGETVAPEPRAVVFHTLTGLAWEPPDLTVEVVCSAGTYIRSLAHDLGERLGCGAHLRALTRLAAGPFRLEQAHPLDELRALAAAGRLTAALLPPAAALSDFPTVTLTPEQARAVGFGQRVVLPAVSVAPQLSAVDSAGQLVAVLIPDGDGWRPDVVFSLEQTDDVD
jgi:tRNA pseudouridine55 synthase